MARTRRQIAEELIALERDIAPTVAKINALEELLREMAAADGAGFLEQIGVDSVRVTAGSEEKFKGITPVLKPEAFLALSESRQAKLVGDGIIVMEQQWSRARKPSVNVRLGDAPTARKR